MRNLQAALWALPVIVGLWGDYAYGQTLSRQMATELAALDRAICSQQWERAIELTSGLIASSEVSSAYRKELLTFRRQLQIWQISERSPSSQASCDRVLPFVLTLEPAAAPEPRPLDWNRALAAINSPRPIIQLDENFDPVATLIPAELTEDSPSILAEAATPIDTSDGFNVVGNQLTRGYQVYSFLARLGDQIALEVDATRVHSGRGNPRLFLFDQSGRLLGQNNLESDISPFLIETIELPKTDVYFAVVSGQETVPILDSNGLISGWQTGHGNFNYTLTLTGVTPYQALSP